MTDPGEQVASTPPNRGPRPDPHGVSFADVYDQQPDAYGKSFADVYDQWYHDVTDAEATAELVDTACPTGPIMEFGVGTGRLAKPLAGRGRLVVGIDASVSMLVQCPPSAALRVLADMRAVPAPNARFAGVLIAFNTLFNVTSLEGQRRVMAEAARLITPEGSVVVEVMDGALLAEAPESSIGISRFSENGVVLSAAQTDTEKQIIDGRHIDIDHRGVRVRPWRLRWLTRAQLDDVAAEVGLRPRQRRGSAVTIYRSDPG